MNLLEALNYVLLWLKWSVNLISLIINFIANNPIPKKPEKKPNDK